jgi:hypothetical protein
VSNNRRDFIEGHIEHIVKDEGEPRGGRQPSKLGTRPRVTINEPELASLILSIAMTNVWNRPNVATRQVASE